MFEDVLFAFKTFRRAKIRSALSLLGVIIGVASVIIVGTLGESAQANIKKSMGDSNLSMIQVSAGYMRRNAQANLLRLDESLRERLASLNTHIKKIWYQNALSATLTAGDLSFSRGVSAVEYGYIEACGLTFESGTPFLISDDVEGTQVLILGTEAAKALFPEGGAVGSRVLMQAEGALFGFTVRGVLSGSAAGFESPEQNVYVPRGFYLRKIAPAPESSWAAVEAREPRYVTQITEDIKRFAEERAGDPFALSVYSMQALLEQYREVTSTISLLLSGIAAISLLVGGIGIMNIMIVTVTERKQEIGIRKAIGASPAAIRAQFLIESAVITLTGGFIGIAAGIAAGAAIVAALKWSFAVAWSSCAVAFLFSAGIGVFFGFYPAVRAARLDPVKALSAE